MFVKETTDIPTKHINQKDVYVILPAHNEAAYISRVLEKLHKVTAQYIVVDDGSSDETAGIARKHAKHVLVHKINLGKGAALKTGCEYAFEHLGAKAVVFMDSDDQHDPAELELFYSRLLAGEQLLFGVRSFTSTMPLIKIIGNRLASFIVYTFFGSYVPDIPSGYKAMTKEVYEKVYWQATNYSVELEIAVRCAKHAIPFSAVPITTIYHDHDKGMTLLDVFTMIFHVVVWRIYL